MFEVAARHLGRDADPDQVTDIVTGIAADVDEDADVVEYEMRQPGFAVMLAGPVNAD